MNKIYSRFFVYQSEITLEDKNCLLYLRFLRFSKRLDKSSKSMSSSLLFGFTSSEGMSGKSMGTLGNCGISMEGGGAVGCIVGGCNLVRG